MKIKKIVIMFGLMLLALSSCVYAKTVKDEDLWNGLTVYKKSLATAEPRKAIVINAINYTDKEYNYGSDETQNVFLNKVFMFIFAQGLY